MNWESVLEELPAPDQAAMETAQTRWNSIAKPLGSLGLLEDEIVRIAGIQGTPNVKLDKRAVVVMCADNGVVAEGVTQTGQEVTAIVAENMSTGATSVCRMAKRANAKVIPVDVGVAIPLTGEHILQKNIRRGTRNLAKEPAMTRAEATTAIQVGFDLVGELARAGYNLIATGEMGIGNTTTSSALVAVLLNRPVEEVTGRGAGLTGDGLERKIKAIQSGIDTSQPDPNDPLDALAKVGGLDIAGLVGVFLGGAYYHIPVLVDGFISSAAALVASRMAPNGGSAMVGSHASEEPAGKMVLDALGLRPFLYAGMRLGEGTGAVAVMPILDMAQGVYSEMCTFDDADIDAYQELT